MGKTYGLLRISDKHRQQDGPSIEVQNEKVGRWCQANDAEMGTERTPGQAPGVFADIGKSAYRKLMSQRPEAQRLLSVLKRGDRIVVSRIDRIFRNMLDFCRTMDHFQKIGVTLCVVEPPLDFSSACGRLLAHLLAAFAEFESAIKSERNKAANEAKKARGVVDATKKKRKRKPQVDGEYVPITKKMREMLPKCGRVWIYRRVSHKDQVASGLGLEWQKMVGNEEASKIIALSPHMAFGGEFVDEGVSASKTQLCERPGGRKLCEIVEPGDVVIFPRLDRGFRDTRDMLNTLPDWIKAGIEVRIVDQRLDFSQWTGMITLEVLTLAAKIEAMIISARNKETKEYLDSRGRQSGTAPRFFRAVRNRYFSRLVWDKRKLAIYKLCRLWHNSGMVWQWEICDRLEALLAKRENRPPHTRFSRMKRSKRKYNYSTLIHSVHYLPAAEAMWLEQRENRRLAKLGVPIERKPAGHASRMAAARPRLPAPETATTR